MDKWGEGMNKLALVILAVGLALCVVALTGLPGWYAGVVHLGVWEQFTLLLESAWLPLFVLLAIWLERLLWHGSLLMQPDRLRRYQALPKWRKDVTRYLEGVLAAVPAAIALVLLFDINLMMAAGMALLVFGGAMWWLSSAVAFDPKIGGQAAVEQA